MLDSLGWNGDLERSRDRCDMVIRASSLTERCSIPKLAMIASFKRVQIGDFNFNEDELNIIEIGWKIWNLFLK